MANQKFLNLLYMHKTYNSSNFCSQVCSLKFCACNAKTLSNLAVDYPDSDHELYILVDDHPTKDKVVWQTLVDVNNVINKLKELIMNNIFHKVTKT